MTIVHLIGASLSVWLCAQVVNSEDDSNVKFPKRPVTSEERLIHDLFVDYDTDARPVVNTTTSVLVTVQFLLLHIHRLDERSQVLMTTGLLLADWTDQRLKWDPGDYGNISDVVVRSPRIWLPELTIINGADDMFNEFEKIRVLIKSNGDVHWEPGGVFATSCDIDILYFPFDTQACAIQIGAWTYTTLRMNLSNPAAHIEAANLNMNGEWDMYATQARWSELVIQPGSSDGYSLVVFTIHMHRRHAYYIVNIILPSSLLSGLVLLVFCVPPEAGEKIGMGISIVVAFTVFLLTLASTVPRISLDVPILVMYLGLTMGLGTASVCFTVIVLHLHHQDCSKPVPAWARNLFLLKCARLVLMPDVQSVLLHQQQAAHESIGADRLCHKAKPSTSSIQSPPSSSKVMTSRVSSRCETKVSPSFSLNPMTSGASAHQRSRSHLDRSTNACDSDVRAESFLTETTLQFRNRNQTLPSAPGNKQENCSLKEWQLLARVIDRIFFCIVVFIMTSSTCLILLSPWYAKQYYMPPPEVSVDPR